MESARRDEGREVLRRRGTTADVVVREVSVADRPALWRRTLGRRLIRREREILRHLSGVPGVPRLIGAAGPDGFLFEYEPGRLFTEFTSESRLPAAFLAGLEETVAEIHRRGIAHGDLANRENILVGPDFRPTIFDFGVAARRDARFPPFAPALFRLLADLDRRAVRKYRARHSEDPAERAMRLPPHPLERLARGLKRMNVLHRAAKDRRKRRGTKEVIHLGSERWRGRRPSRTQITWVRGEGLPPPGGAP